jgi:hypothetical protein
VNELGSRERKQPPPPRIVFECLADPHRSGARPWLELADVEIEPRVLESIYPALIVWSSLWPSRPDDVIRFDLRPAGQGCALRWTLLTPSDGPDAALLGWMRYRLNYLINGRLRFSFGQ